MMTARSGDDGGNGDVSNSTAFKQVVGRVKLSINFLGIDTPGQSFQLWFTQMTITLAKVGLKKKGFYRVD